MEIIFVILALVLIAALAPPYGSDSRHLDDESWQRDGLWSRAPRA
jgi:hypothetical protein